MSFEWNDDLITGIADIDSQHKELFARLNRLLQECRSFSDKNAIGAYLGFLREYVVFHFAAEEREMTTHHYPGLAAHEAEHELFRQKVSHLADNFATHGADIQVFVMTIRSSGEWLVNHISETDKALAAFLKKQADA